VGSVIFSLVLALRMALHGSFGRTGFLYPHHRFRWVGQDVNFIKSSGLILDQKLLE
jgi:hypothetical protein